MRYLSLFSGIGAHDLGFERAGWQCAGQVEIDPFCRAVLEKHWPHVPRFEDVRHVSAGDVVERCGPVDCITGGFACQDISVAGAGAGITRISRSGITFRNLFRLARQLRPSLLVIENVAALKSRGYDRIAAVLERIGYAVWPFLVAASDVGAPHLRRRVWIVGMRDDGRLGRGMADAYGLRQSQSEGSLSGLGRRVGDGGEKALADTDSFRSAQDPGDRELRPDRIEQSSSNSGLANAAEMGKASAGKESGYVVANSDDKRLARRGALSSGAGEKISMPAGGVRYRWPSGPGEPQHEWEAPRLAESPMGSTASRSAGRLGGFARRNALKAFGNANPPQVAELIARTINATVAHLEAGAA